MRRANVFGKQLPIIISVAILMLLVWAIYPKPIPVETAKVRKGPFQEIISEDGRTRAKEKFVISAPVSGHFLRPRIKAGDPIHQGDVLGEMVPALSPFLDPRSRRENVQRLAAANAEVSRIQSLIEAAQAALVTEKREFRRTEALARSGFAAKSELDQSRLELKKRQEDLDAAQAALDRAQHEADRIRVAMQSPATSSESGTRVEIRAPVSGTVLRVAQESEAVVNAGTTLIEVADPQNLEIVVDVLSSDAVRVKTEAPVVIKNWGGDQTLDGEVRTVEPSAFTKISALGVEEQRVNVIIDIATPREYWRGLGEGFRIDAEITTLSLSDTIKVPIGALFREGANWAVFVVRDGKVRRQTIQLAARNENEAAVSQGVSPGDEVVLYPSESVHDQVRVKKAREL